MSIIRSIIAFLGKQEKHHPVADTTTNLGGNPYQEIQQLLNENKTKEALDLFAQSNRIEADLMQARYVSLLKSAEDGKLNGEEFQINLNRIHFSLLELASQPKGRHKPAINLEPQVREWITQGKTETAIDAMIEAGYAEVAALKSRLISSMALFEEGKISYEALSQVQVAVNLSLLNLFKDGKSENTDHVIEPPAPINEVPMPGDIKEKARQLILLQYQTEEALELCEKYGTSFRLLKKRYQEAKQQWNLGLIDQNTWTMIQQRTDESLLYLLDQQPLA